MFLKEEQLLRFENKIFLNEASLISLEAEMYQRKESVARVEAVWFPFDVRWKSPGQRHFIEQGQDGKRCDRKQKEIVLEARLKALSGSVASLNH